MQQLRTSPQVFRETREHVPEVRDVYAVDSACSRLVISQAFKGVLNRVGIAPMLPPRIRLALRALPVLEHVGRMEVTNTVRAYLDVQLKVLTSLDARPQGCGRNSSQEQVRGVEGQPAWKRKGTR